MRNSTCAFLAIIAAALAGCTAGEATPAPTTPTWEKAYNDTTCTDWNGPVMSPEMRTLMATDLLLTLRPGDKAVAPWPSPDVVVSFEQRITTLCAPAAAAARTVTDAAKEVYDSDRSKYRP